jgi:hypothetical protein
MGYEFRDGSRLERRVDGLQVKVHVMWWSHWREGSCCVVVCRQCQLEAVDEVVLSPFVVLINMKMLLVETQETKAKPLST